MIISLHPQTYSDKGFRPYNQRYYIIFTDSSRNEDKLLERKLDL